MQVAWGGCGGTGNPNHETQDASSIYNVFFFFNDIYLSSIYNVNADIITLIPEDGLHLHAL